MSVRLITKKLSSFTIDKEVIKEFDRLVPNNEKSLRVELLIKEFVNNNPDGVRSLKNRYIMPEKRGKHD